MTKKPAKSPKSRQFSPKLRAATLADRRTKRNRTRGDQKRRAIADG